MIPQKIEPQDFDRITAEETPQAKRIAEFFRDAASFGPMRIIDIGCGPGIYVNAMLELGLDAWGIDSDERLVESARLRRVDIVTEGHIPFRGTFDVALSLEVGEHIPEEYADDYVNYIRETCASVVYFSAARPGQGGIGHINCQPKAYWTRKMHQGGYFLDPEATEYFVNFMRGGYHMGWLVQNAMVFRRGV